MKTTSISAFEGPNSYCNKLVLRVRFEAPELCRPIKHPSSQSLVEILSQNIPHFAKLALSIGGISENLPPINSLPLIALSLQNLGSQTSPYQHSTALAELNPTGDQFEMAFQYESESVARQAVPLSFRILIAILHRHFEVNFPKNLQAPDSFDIKSEIERFATISRPYILDENTRSIVRALEKRQIPWHRIDEHSNLIQAAYGKQRRLIHVNNNQTDHALCNDNTLSYALLRQSSIPLPQRSTTSSLEGIKKYAHSFTYPVILKPEKNNSSTLLTIKANNETELEAAFTQIQTLTASVIIEKFRSGNIYRFVLIGKNITAIFKRIKSTSDVYWQEISEADTVIHPDNSSMIERAASALNLDKVKIGVISKNLSHSYLEGGLIIHKIGSHIDYSFTSAETSYPIATAAVEHYFPSTSLSPPIIPSAAITGSHGKTTTSRMLDSILQQAGYYTSMANSDGLYLNGQLVMAGQQDNFDGNRSALTNPQVEAAVLETSQADILKRGLAFSACSVSAVLNISPDPVGFDDEGNLEGMANIKLLVASLAQNTVILNADDPLCVDMIPQLNKCRLSLVSRHPDNITSMANANELHSLITLTPGKQDHVQNIVIRANGTETQILKTLEIPATHFGIARHQVDNALFATAIAHSMGIGIESIQKALRKFTSDFDQNPGRCNIISDANNTVLLDFGHTPEAITAMGDLVDNMENEGQRVCVLSAPDHLMEKHYIAMAEVAAQNFDSIICSNFYQLSDKEPEYVPQQFSSALLHAGFDPDQILINPDPDQSIRTALQQIKNDDILVIFGDQPKRRRALVLETLDPVYTPESLI